ncbi:hypothetical protein TNCV_3273451 [Trichonephila clavipes]|nr:hypothetical protein TNCV_3273451 [Trichonephila clavipes]
MYRHTGPEPDIMVCGGIEFYCRTFLVRIAGTLNSQRYTSKSMLVQRLARDTPDQLWRFVKAAWRLLYPKDPSKASLIVRRIN